MRTIQTVGALLLLLLLFGLAGQGDREEEERQLALYCEMVERFKATNGQTGWPPFDGEEQCK